MHFTSKYYREIMFSWTFILIIVCVCGISCSPRLDNERGQTRTFDTKAMLSSLASTFMSRGYLGDTGSSQVISLNLTNLLVLFLLKALIFAAGSIGAGTWKGGYARSDDGEEQLITDEELLLFLSYLSGYPGKNGCLQHIVCQEPQQAKRYGAAGDLLLKLTRMLSSEEPDIKYNYVLKEIQEAVKYSENGGDCTKYICGS